MAEGKVTEWKWTCGGTVAIGRRTRAAAREKDIPVSAAAEEASPEGDVKSSLDQLTKLFDSIFTSQLDLKAPGVYGHLGGYACWVAVNTSGKIISREFFSVLTEEEDAGVDTFVRRAIPDAHHQELGGEPVSRDSMASGNRRKG